MSSENKWLRTSVIGITCMAAGWTSRWRVGRLRVSGGLLLQLRCVTAGFVVPSLHARWWHRAGLSRVGPSASCVELGCLRWILALHMQSWIVSGGFQCSTRFAGLCGVDPSASFPLTEGCILAIAKRDAKLLASSALLPLSPPQLWW